MDRRRFSTGALVSAFAIAASPSIVNASPAKAEKISNALKDIEAKSQGRLGVHMISGSSAREFGYRSDELFMMLSSFKFLASALVLARVDRGLESLDRRIQYSKQDVLSWAPVTKDHADGDGLTLEQLCHATVTTSDNTAANLILNSYGGPKALTEFVRGLGDSVTRLDRMEPHLNTRHETEPLDTTSPRAMARAMKTLLTGNILTEKSRKTLQQWLLANTTGGKRLKAGIPETWLIGDKTGTNQTDANDIGVIYPPLRAPIFVTAYLADSTASSQLKDETLADVGRVAATYMT